MGKDIIQSFTLYQEEEESSSSSKRPNSKLKKDLGSAIFPIFILFILFFVGLVSYVLFVSKNMDLIYKIFMNQTIFILFMFFTFFLFIFGIIHISYIYTNKRFRNTEDDKHILKNTFGGYMLTSISYLIFTIVIIYLLSSKEEINDHIFIGLRVLYGILGLISIILLSIGLAKIKNDDKKDKLYVPSAIATTLVALNTFIISIGPILCSMYKNTNNKNNNNNNKYIELLERAANNSGSIRFKI
jgi:hypothetical protein